MECSRLLCLGPSSLPAMRLSAQVTLAACSALLLQPGVVHCVDASSMAEGLPGGNNKVAGTSREQGGFGVRVGNWALFERQRSLSQFPTLTPKTSLLVPATMLSTPPPQAPPSTLILVVLLPLLPLLQPHHRQSHSGTCV